MKLYRVLPNIFLVNNKLDQVVPRGIEGIYYNMGYTTFTGNMGSHAYNTIYENITEEGKYFFLFFEDAFTIGRNFLCDHHRLSLKSYIIIEYDVPLDIILKHIGYGNYELNSPLNLIETYIQRSDFIGNQIDSDMISCKTKEDFLLREYRKTLEELLKLGYNEDIDYYLKKFDIYYRNMNELKNILEDEKELKYSLKRLINPFDSSFRYLIETPYITKRVVQVNPIYIYNNIGEPGSEELKLYFKELGFKYDTSLEHKELKEYLLEYLKENNLENVRRLLEKR